MKRNITIIILALSVLSSCRKEAVTEPCTDPLNPNCINYHPCNGVQPVTADFEMWYAYQSADKLILVEEDSVFPVGAIVFRAKLNGATYLWQLGKDTETVQQDYRIFSNKIGQVPPDTSAWGTFYNTLTVNKTPSIQCYPNDVQTASLTRSITILKPSKLLTSGMFKVLYEGDVDSTIIQFQPWGADFTSNPNYNRESDDYRVIIGFKGTYRDTLLAKDYIFTNKKIRFLNSSTLGFVANGEITVNPLDLKIDGYYSIASSSTEKPLYRFKGRKL